MKTKNNRFGRIKVRNGDQPEALKEKKLLRKNIKVRLKS